METADDSDILDLLLGKLTVGAVNLGKNVARIDEEDSFIGLGFIEEPERCRECDSVEHVRRQGEHTVDEIVLYECPADVGL